MSEKRLLVSFSILKPFEPRPCAQGLIRMLLKFDPMQRLTAEQAGSCLDVVRFGGFSHIRRSLLSVAPQSSPEAKVSELTKRQREISIG